MNADGSIDIFFAPNEPNDAGNWIKTVSGKGWFPIFRFYGPKQAFFDKSWVLQDIEPIAAQWHFASLAAMRIYVRS